jgi:hypothetical protein
VIRTVIFLHPIAIAIMCSKPKRTRLESSSSRSGAEQALVRLRMRRLVEAFSKISMLFSRFFPPPVGGPMRHWQSFHFRLIIDPPPAAITRSSAIPARRHRRGKRDSRWGDAQHPARPARLIALSAHRDILLCRAISVASEGSGHQLAGKNRPVRSRMTRFGLARPANYAGLIH